MNTISRHLRASLASFVCLLFIPTSCWSAGSFQWEFWIQQGELNIHNPTFVKLKKAPFQMKFRGPGLNAYGLAATTDQRELPQSDDLSSVFRIGNGLTADQPSTKISVSLAGVITKGWSSWNIWEYQGPAQKDSISSFQERYVNGDSTVTLIRNISLICTDDGQRDKCNPLYQSPFSKFFVLMTTIPELKPGEKVTATRWLQPRMLTVEFE